MTNIEDGMMFKNVENVMIIVDGLEIVAGGSKKKTVKKKKGVPKFLVVLLVS